MWVDPSGRLTREGYGMMVAMLSDNPLKYVVLAWLFPYNNGTSKNRCRLGGRGQCCWWENQELFFQLIQHSPKPLTALTSETRRRWLMTCRLDLPSLRGSGLESFVMISAGDAAPYFQLYFHSGDGRRCLSSRVAEEWFARTSAEAAYHNFLQASYVMTARKISWSFYQKLL